MHYWSVRVFWNAWLIVPSTQHTLWGDDVSNKTADALVLTFFYRLKLWLYFTKSHRKPELILGDTQGDHDVKSGLFRDLWK